MSNKPNFRRGTSLAEFAQKRREEGSVEIPMTIGDPIVVPPREFWTRTTNDLLATQSTRLSKEDRATDEQIARSIIGDEAFNRFAAELETAAGPDQDAGAFFFRYLAAEVERMQGVDEGE